MGGAISVDPSDIHSSNISSQPLDGVKSADEPFERIPLSGGEQQQQLQANVLGVSPGTPPGSSEQEVQCVCVWLPAVVPAASIYRRS